MAALTENTEVEEPDDGGEDFEPSGNTPTDPTGGSPTGGPKRGSSGTPKASGKSGGKEEVKLSDKGKRVLAQVEAAVLVPYQDGKHH